MDTADPAFPRPAGYWWFGCKAESKGGNPGNNAWFLSGPYPGLSGGSVGDTSRGSSLGDDNDSHSSDVDDLILDAGEQTNEVAKSLLPAAKSAYYWLCQVIKGLTDIKTTPNITPSG